jgi:peptide deformylase
MIVMYDNPALIQKCLPFDFDKQDPEAIFEELKLIMIASRGIGLSAPQIGLPYRVFIVGHPEDEEGIFPVFNPMLVYQSETKEAVNEGCLSFPGINLKIKRPLEIRSRYYDIKGNADTHRYAGVTARIFQHEYDHLDGILFTRRASHYHAEKALKDLKFKNRRLRNEKII